MKKRYFKRSNQKRYKNRYFKEAGNSFLPDLAEIWAMKMERVINRHGSRYLFNSQTTLSPDDLFEHMPIKASNAEKAFMVNYLKWYWRYGSGLFKWAKKTEDFINVEMR